MIHLPTTLTELEHVGPLDDDTVVRSGGTDLQARLRSNNVHPTIVDLGGISTLAQISQDDDGWRIGSGVTLSLIHI